MIIGEQVNYLQNKDLGYNKDQVIIIPTNKNRADGYALAQLYKNELLKNPQVQNVSASTFSFAESSWSRLGYSDDNKQFHSFQYNEMMHLLLMLCRYRFYKVEVFHLQILPIQITA
jgi:putative ABC transport system permease protein